MLNYILIVLLSTFIQIKYILQVLVVIQLLKFFINFYNSTIAIKSTKKNKLAILVTGASSGIGKACVEEFIQSGFHVYGTIRKKQDSETLKSEFSTKNFTPLILDVTDSESIEKALKVVKNKGIPLFGLVNNAGLACSGPIEIMQKNQFQKTFDVNVIGLLDMTRQCLSLLRECSSKNEVKEARIVHISSVAGLFAAPKESVYCGSKWAVQAISGALNGELDRFNIRSVTVNPGAVTTDITKNAFERYGGDYVNFKKPELKSVYKAYFERYEKRYRAKKMIKGIPPKKCAQSIVNVMTCRSPPKSIIVGNEKTAIIFALMLPDFILDYLLKKI